MAGQLRGALAEVDILRSENSSRNRLIHSLQVLPLPLPSMPKVTLHLWYLAITGGGGREKFTLRYPHFFVGVQGVFPESDFCHFYIGDFFLQSPICVTSQSTDCSFLTSEQFQSDWVGIQSFLL